MMVVSMFVLFFGSWVVVVFCRRVWANVKAAIIRGDAQRRAKLHQEIDQHWDNVVSNRTVECPRCKGLVIYKNQLESIEKHGVCVDCADQEDGEIYDNIHSNELDYRENVMCSCYECPMSMPKAVGQA